ncbi:MAG: DUF2271 domain-containing protein [Pseudomonadaceae bacterium]
MHKSLLVFCALAGGLATTLTSAAQLEIEVQIPRLQVAEYHRPYVALWLEQDDQHLADIAVWYDLRLADQEGEKWLKDLRQWWRRSGRGLEMPIDGLSAATRPPGTHRLQLDGAQAPLEKLEPGAYVLVIEAAREVGGRELLRLPFQWPPQQSLTSSALGNSELGRVRLSVSP